MHGSEGTPFRKGMMIIPYVKTMRFNYQFMDLLFLFAASTNNFL